MTTTPHRRSALAAMYAGLALTVAALAAPFVDHATGDVLAEHIRAGYPAYAPARIDSAVAAWLVYLSVVGALGVGCWLATIWAVRAGRRWARGVATAAFVLAVGVALTNLLITDTSGDTGLPPLLGWIGVLPCAAGMMAVALLWRERIVPSR